MNIYQPSNKENFLQEVINFACDNFSHDFSKLKIILPTGLLCTHLQREFIRQLNTSILPTIIPLGELVAEDEEVFKIPSKQIGSITKLEEKITLAATIHSYEKLSYNLSQSLALAPSLANLFFEFEANNIDISDLKNLPALDQPEHWHIIFDFLQYASNNWKEKIASMHKMTRASHQKLTFESELKRLKNNSGEFLLLAGITGSNAMSCDFIKKSTELNNVYLILPPSVPTDKTAKFLPEDGLYQINKLMKLFDDKKIKLVTIAAHKTNILDKLLAPTESNELTQDIKYVECENIFHEAEYIAIECSKHNNINIAIIAHNQKSKEQYAIYLDKYNVKYHDIFGIDILKKPVISLILLIAENLCSEFNLKNFFTIISHPLINSEHAQRIKNLIRKKNRLASNLEAISALIEENGDDELKEYYSHLYKIISTKARSNKFINLFKHTIELLEELIPEIWQDNPDISASLAEIVQSNWQISLKDIKDFPELLKQTLEGGRLSNTESSAKITICRPHEAALINYDIVIITDLNENIYPSGFHSSPWLNLTMQKELGLFTSLAILGDSLYDFYLNMQNKKIILTRSRRQGSLKQLLPSPFLLHLMHILGDRFNKIVAKLEKPNIQTTEINTYAKGKIFPDQISATDIETLIRAPYNFYAKKILRLKKIEEIDEKPNLAEFGNFFHLVAEKYTKNYNKKESDKILSFTQIGQDLLDTLDIPEYSKKAWGTKLSAIAPEFIEFDEARRENSSSIYTELKGKLQLNICGKPINIIAIADRIEVNHNNIATIIDYKTGVVPTKKDVLSGLSPQLIIEAIILSENGFNIKSSEVHKLIYVKINSSAPYIKTTEIKITKEDLSDHKNGLIELLEYYVENMNFVIEPSQMSYDNYSHLARR